MAIVDIVISDIKGKLDTMAEAVNLATHFSGGRGSVTYSVMPPKSLYVTATVTDGMLSVSLMGTNVPYSNQTVTVSATDGVDTKNADISVRRNKPPTKAATIVPHEITVGTQYPHATGTCAIDPPEEDDAPDAGPNIMDDADDTITYTGETSVVSNGDRVDIGFAKAGVMVTGLKSTLAGTDFSAAASAIMIDVTGTDSDDKPIVARNACTVRVDQAPKKADTPVLRDVVIRLSEDPDSDADTVIEVVSIGAHFEDPEDETLTYEVSSSDKSVATVSDDDSDITIRAIGEGTATITVTALEPTADADTAIAEKDQTAKDTFVVTVLAD